MNRLVIIGNGFDLAHKMKTSYYDFIFSYLENSFIQAMQDRLYEDDIIKIVRNSHVVVPNIDKMASVNDLLSFNESSRSNAMIIGNILDDDYNERTPKKAFTLKIKREFIGHLFTKCCDYNWVDIENEYYESLIKLLDSTDGKIKNKKLEALNDSMKLLISLLNDYLELQKPTHLTTAYISILEEEIKKQDVVTVTLPQDFKPESTLILNFNYTNTIEAYFKDNAGNGQKLQNIKVNFIHGRVNDEGNPIIFGFGDELDSEYSKIESEKRKEFLRFIKSFWYFKTSNYHDLIRFIELKNFQVYILGHSCGLSDRTMLNMIFEHSNCKSIKIFYHKTETGNNFTELTQEISRHFHDKGEMRKKIVPFNKCSPMPQSEK